MTDYVDARRRRAVAAWNSKDDVVLIGAGDFIAIPGAGDQTYFYRAHAEYRWLTDREFPGAVLAFDPSSGWTHFVPRVTEKELVWEGRQPHNEGEPIEALAGWLAARRGRNFAMLGSPLPGVFADPGRTASLRELLTHARRPKDQIEIARLQRAAAATAAGYDAIAKFLRPGVTERQIQIELESAFMRAGGTRTAYDTIVGTSTDAAVLHFTPTERVVGDNDLVLIDAGAEVEGYACDVTRTFAASGNYTSLQKDIYDIVLSAEVNAISMCRAGVEYRDIHLAAARDMTAGLVHIGLMRGNVDSLIEQDAHTLFFPHGVGHMVGLGVRDASGMFPGRKKSDRPGLATLRNDFPLENDYVVTIEPGLYFIPALLQDHTRREKFAQQVNWPKVDQHLDFGGVRIEDNVLVTPDGPVVLTAAIPK